ncbi:Rnf-Nqr domain containing protein [Aeromonas rivipollensis]|uniref:Rnf-Nqr domain containing protein n=1 Tax=Aeromonas rivipollensis TaxID=948519 RepID=UPI003D227E16
MDYYVNLFIQSIFVENLALAFFLGMCTFLAVSKNINTAFGLGMTVLVVMVIAIPLNNLIYRHILRPDSTSGIQIISATLMDEWREVANC